MKDYIGYAALFSCAYLADCVFGAFLHAESVMPIDISMLLTAAIAGVFWADYTRALRQNAILRSVSRAIPGPKDRTLFRVDAPP